MINWEKCNGLVPAVVQDANTGKVLMLGFMNAEALKITTENKKVTFYSRTRKMIWTKGESSGNFLELIDIVVDCDQDSLLVFANPAGPTCHNNTASCFNTEKTYLWETLTLLEKTIQDRKEKRPENSYTAELFNAGINKIAQKVGEEAVETVIAGLNETTDKLANETADLLYHLLILLVTRNISIQNVFSVLKNR